MYLLRRRRLQARETRDAVTLQTAHGAGMQRQLRVFYLTLVLGIAALFLRLIPLQQSMTRVSLPPYYKHKRDWHVVVVGGGLAGLTAATQALHSGASRVTLIEKVRLGGNSAKATSGMNAAGTQHQHAIGIQDSVDLFYQDTLQSGQGAANHALVMALAARSADGLALVESVCKFNLSHVVLLGGHSVPRTHRSPSNDKPVPLGLLIVNQFKEYLKPEKWDGRLEVLENTQMLDVILPPGKDLVEAVIIADANNATAQPRSMPLDALVMASGGFSADLGPDGLLAKYNPTGHMCKFTTNGAFAVGDGLRVAMKLGLDTVDLQDIQMHPTAFIHPNDPLGQSKFLCPEVFRGSGALLLNRVGRRFVNELLRRDEVSTAMFNSGSAPSVWGLPVDGDVTDVPVALMLMNGDVRMAVNAANFDFYVAKGFIQKFDGLPQLADKFGWDIATVRQNLQEYCDSAGQSSPDSFGKSVYPTTFADILSGAEIPVYTAFVTPAFHYTMGGVKVNQQMQMLRHGGIITNLFGAGEFVGGLHGKNRLGGNGLAESATFGMLAGKNAALLGKNVHPVTLSSRVSASIDSIDDTERDGTKSITLALESLSQEVRIPLGAPCILQIGMQGSWLAAVQQIRAGYIVARFVENVDLPRMRPGMPVQMAFLEDKSRGEYRADSLNSCEVTLGREV